MKTTNYSWWALKMTLQQVVGRATFNLFQIINNFIIVREILVITQIISILSSDLKNGEVMFP